MIKMNKKLFYPNEEQLNEIKAGFILALFSLLYKEEKITYKELKSLKNNVYRTFNIQKDLC